MKLSFILIRNYYFNDIILQMLFLGINLHIFSISFTNFSRKFTFWNEKSYYMPPLSYCTLKFIECADFVTRLNLVYGQMVYKYYIQQCIFVVFVIYIVS